VTPGGSSLLAVDGLTISFGDGAPPVVRDVAFELRSGEVVALVGESGSGKSTIALAAMGLLDAKTARVAGRVELARKQGGRTDLLSLPERDFRHVRGTDMAMIFQEPMMSLDPIYRIGEQIGEALAVHRAMPAAEREAEALRLLTILGVPSPDRTLERYPHELSGGMRQRVMIAMAISCHPLLLIADEPTTALDVTIQAQIVDQLRLLQRRNGMAILFITHDLGLVAEIADRVLVMYAGQIVESGTVAEVFRAPRMPYTAGLMRSRPKIGGRRTGAGRIAAIPGSAPNPAALPSGCAFHPRCAFANGGDCRERTPPLVPSAADRLVRCWRWREIAP
jgi:oligopeptide/dipeptide ABC transporter ATP-binding protein